MNITLQVFRISLGHSELPSISDQRGGPSEGARGSNNHDVLIGSTTCEQPGAASAASLGLASLRKEFGG